jgi:hypothetical protein
LATIPFVYELLHPGCIAPQQSETRSKFGKDGSNTAALGFLRKVLVPAGAFEMPYYFRGPANRCENSAATLISISAAGPELVSHTTTQLCLGESSMPRYYFHVRRGQITVLDQEGIELADTVDAELQAAQRAKQVVSGAAMNGASMNGASMNGASMNEGSASRGGIIVADDNWQTLFELPF